MSRLRLALRAIVLLWLASPLTAAHGQSSCGIISVTETTKLVYPAIARAAHVEGDIVFMVSFTQTGDINTVRVLSGPEMLRASAQEFVKGWKVNSYSGPRECPVAIHYRIGKESSKPNTEITRLDTQHVRITAETFVMYAPNY